VGEKGLRDECSGQRLCFQWVFRSLIGERPALRTLLRLMSSARRAVADAKSDAAGDGFCEEDVVTTTVRRRTGKAKCISIRARTLGISIVRTLVDTSESTAQSGWLHLIYRQDSRTLES